MTAGDCKDCKYEYLCPRDFKLQSEVSTNTCVHYQGKYQPTERNKGGLLNDMGAWV